MQELTTDEKRDLVIQQLQRRKGEWIPAQSLCDVFGIDQAHIDREGAISSLDGFERQTVEVNINHHPDNEIPRDRVQFRFVGA